MRIKGSTVSLKVLDNIKASEGNSTKDFIFLQGRILTCDEPNANGDYFPKDEVKASYRTFIGKIVDFNHDENIVLGRIIDSQYIQEDKKDGKDCVEIICKINKHAYKDIVSQIESGVLRQMSLEAYADRARCSMCDFEFNFIDIDPCDHIKGGLMREIEGEDGHKHLIFKKDYGLTFVGAGVVPNPADKKADIDKLIASAYTENDNIIKETEEKINEDKLEEAKKKVEPLVEGTNMESALKKLSALELINLVSALKNKYSGKTEVIAKEIAEKINVVTSEELFDILSKNYNRMSTIEIEEIKAYLKKEGKFIDSSYSVYKIEEEENSKPVISWVVMKNSLPILKASLEQIFGEQELNSKTMIDGLTIKEYAQSDAFRRNLLVALTQKGENYIKESWQVKSLGEEPSIEEVIGKIFDIELKDTNKILSSVEEIKNLLKQGLNKIKNPIVKSNMELLEKCIGENKENKEIETQKGQNQQEAIEAHCFKKVMSSIKASEGSIFEKLLKSNKDMPEEFKAWLNYKVSGNWPKNSAAQKAMIKVKALEIMKKINSLYIDEQRVIEASAKYMKDFGFDNAFIKRYALVASEKDIKHLFDIGLTTNDVKRLYSVRFI